MKIQILAHFFKIFTFISFKIFKLMPIFFFWVWHGKYQINSDSIHIDLFQTYNFINLLQVLLDAYYVIIVLIK